VALLWQIVSTGLQSAVGLVFQVPIDVNIGDSHKPSWENALASLYSVLSSNNIREFRQYL
jgi:hypothetical protein